MDEFPDVPITDPASVLIGLGALAGLLAVWCWWNVAASVDTGGERVRGPSPRYVSYAAITSAFALGLASFGYLLGRFTGRF